MDNAIEARLAIQKQIFTGKQSFNFPQSLLYWDPTTEYWTLATREDQVLFTNKYSGPAIRELIKLETAELVLSSLQN